MTCLPSHSEFAAFALARPPGVRRPKSMRAATSSVVRAGAVILALSSLAVPDAVLHAKWFKLGLILDTAARHYAARS